MYNWNSHKNLFSARIKVNIYFGHTQPPHFTNGSALTIGNFDGVHVGHLHILKKLRSASVQRNLPSVLMIFEPQPTEYFARIYGKEMPFRLSPLRDKLHLLEKSNCLDAVWVRRFNHEFATLTADEFIQQILIKQLNIKYLLIGDDFRFGSGRGGGIELLKSQSAFEVEQVPSILLTGNRASSTAVREALSSGRIISATHILGHNYTLSGRVMYGKQLGRTLNCPTANISLPVHHYPMSGVYLCQVNGDFGMRFGVANFGTKPTVSEDKVQTLEVHLFDFNQDLYGKRLSISFLHKLRDEQKFSSIDKLKHQIQQDMQQALAIIPQYQPEII